MPREGPHLEKSLRRRILAEDLKMLPPLDASAETCAWETWLHASPRRNALFCRSWVPKKGDVKHDQTRAVEILVKDLKVFSSFNDDLFKEITQLLTLDNFRENEQLSMYGDTKSALLNLCYSNNQHV